jgi:hypothetical protein
MMVDYFLRMRKYSTLPFVLTVVMMAVAITSSLAQETEPKKPGQGELESVQIDIVIDRKIELPQANRNFEKIPPRPSEPIKPPIVYDFRAFTFQTPQINPLIRPLKLKDAAKSELTGGYVTAGYGNYASPYLEGFYNSKRDKNKLIGAHAYLYSSDKGPVDGTNSGSGMAGISVYGKSFTEALTLSGNVGFENRSTHFYGYAPGTSVDARDIKQFYNLFKLGGEVANARNSDFSYKLGVGFSHLADKFDARETEIDVDFSSAYKVNDDSRFKINAGYYLISRKDAFIDGQGRNLFIVNPAYEFLLIDDLKFSAGITAAFENDSLDSKGAHIYPDIHASYPISPSVDVTGSLTGGIEKVSLQSMLAENIWLEPNVPIFHTNKVFDLQVGLRAKLGNKVSAEAGLSMASLKNWYYYINSPTDQAKFTTIYDQGATKRSNLFVSLGYTQANVARFLVRGDYYTYITKEIREFSAGGLGREFDEPFHRPTYKLSVDASYNVYEKIVLSAKILAMGGMKAWDRTLDKAVKLDAAFDLNFRAEYLFSESFSVFVQLNNITSSKYPLYLNYPARGFQGMGGITWSF